MSLLEVKDLKTSFKTLRGMVTAIDGVSFTIDEGEMVAIIGESGCGKSVTSQSIMRLYPEREGMVKYEGEVLFAGENLLKKSFKEMQEYRGKEIAMVFQDALTALNPVYTIGDQIIEAIRTHKKIDKKAARTIAISLLEKTGIPDAEHRVDAYPHELSGGMRQRAVIALALSCNPRLLIADEPTTALDVTIQAQIMDFIVDLNKKYGMGIMLITHDLGVVAQHCKRAIVMYLGQIVEEGEVDELFKNPLHPYTKGLIKSVPTTNTPKDRELFTINGVVPKLSDEVKGCRFAGRCEYATDSCLCETPELVCDTPNHKVRCFRYREV